MQLVGPESDDSLVWPVGRKIGMFKIHHAQLSRIDKAIHIIRKLGNANEVFDDDGSL